MHVNRKRIFYLSILMTIELIGIIIFPSDVTFYSMAIISVLQLVLNIGFVSLGTNQGIITFSSVFLLFSWFFHCGQIVKLGFNIAGFVPLDVTRYATHYEIVHAFQFYYLTQLMITCGMLFYSSKFNKEKREESYKMNVKKTSHWLLGIGIIPRIYIDITILRNGFSQGYEGVYNLVIPQMFQTLAFFFDAGCIVALMDKSNKKKNTVLFWSVFVYKCITMATGARQERFVFLIVWVMLYYFIINEIKIRDIVTLLVIVTFGVLLINAIGNVRTSESVSFSAIVDSFSNHAEKSILGDMLGEFGSALTTLATTIRNVPSNINYGYGDAYLAGILSIIPTLATRVGLGKAAVYISKLPGSTYFGGSYIGELYYNFSWFGVLGGIIVGMVVMSAQLHIYKCKENELTLKNVYSAIIMISMYLFVRGYFTDMVQRIVWIWIVLKIINEKKIKLSSK